MVQSITKAPHCFFRWFGHAILRLAANSVGRASGILFGDLSEIGARLVKQAISVSLGSMTKASLGIRSGEAASRERSEPVSYTTFNLRKASRNIPGVGGQTRGSRAFIRNVLLDCSIWARTRRVSVLFSLLFAAVLGMMDAQAPFDLENGRLCFAEIGARLVKQAISVSLGSMTKASLGIRSGEAPLPPPV